MESEHSESEFRLSVPQSNENESISRNLKLYRPHRTSPYEINTVENFIAVSCLIALACFNAVCIYQVCRRRKLRPIDYLLVNMSFSVIAFCCICTTLVTHLLDLLPFPQKARCSLINYCKLILGICSTDLAISLISTASFAISYERVSSLDKARRKRKYVLSTSKLVGLVWAAACGIILPTLWTSVPLPDALHGTTNSSFSRCWRVPLFYSKYMDIWYEVVRYLFLHLAFTVCVFSELCMVRSKIKYICLSQTGKMRSKVNRVRCAFVQSVLFVILWNIYGICNVIYAVVTWYSSKSLVVINTTIGIIRGIGLVYTIVNPILLFYSNQPDNRGCIGRCCSIVCLCCLINSINTRNSGGVGAPVVSSSNRDMSRFSTRMQETCGTMPHPGIPEEQEQREECNKIETPVEANLSPNTDIIREPVDEG